MSAASRANVQGWCDLVAHYSIHLNPNAKCSAATELPGDVLTAPLARDLTADLVLEHRPPRDQAETVPVVDHGKSAAGQLRRAQKLFAHGLALFNRRDGKTLLRRRARGRGSQTSDQ